jgi:hypothetical protein
LLFNLHFWGDPLTSEEGEQIAPPCYWTTPKHFSHGSPYLQSGQGIS